jgi:sec-independent protein translocase protein TatC
MTYTPNEDLFESTKMTFGEHLEELRTCLVKSLIGLAVGFLLALLFANWLVQEIQSPLSRALENYYFEKSRGELLAEYPGVSTELIDFMQRQNLVYEEVVWELDELARLERLGREDQEMKAVAKDGPLMVVGNLGAPTSRLVKTRIWKPLEDAKVTSLSAHEPFMIWVKAALMLGAVIASPWIFWQIWSFVAAGLYPHEKSYVNVFLPISLSLFLAGAALAFFFVFDPVLDFLFSFNKWMNIDPDPRISEWMSFVLMLPLGFGISFQLPLVMLLLERIGIMSVASYLDKWRISILVIFVLSMLLTPADPISMLLMAIPLTLLYFGGIAMCKWMPRRRSPYGEGYDPQ